MIKESYRRILTLCYNLNKIQNHEKLMSVDTVKKRKRMKSRKLRSVVTLGERKEGNMIMEGYIGVFN